MENWRDSAACLGSDPELFYVEQGCSTKVAEAICSTCDVQVECLQTALDNKERLGIWGGVSERQRRKIGHMGITAEVYLKGIESGEITPARRGRPRH